jgi:hypothetical protein
VGDDARGHLEREPLVALEEAPEILTVEVLHRDVQPPAVLTEVEHVDHVRTGDARRRLRLAHEAHAVVLFIAQRRVDELHRHVHIEREVASPPHRSHRAAPEQAIDAKAT